MSVCVGEWVGAESGREGVGAGCLEGQARERIHEAVSETASPRLDKGVRA